MNHIKKNIHCIEKIKLKVNVHKEKISQSMKGHLISEETKLKISQKAKQRKRKPWSDEYKKKMSQIMSGKPRKRNNGL